MQIIDDFLPKELADTIASAITGQDLKWNNVYNISSNIGNDDVSVDLIRKLGYTPTPEVFNLQQQMFLYSNRFYYDEVLRDMGYLDIDSPIGSVYEYLKNFFMSPIVVRFKVNCLMGLEKPYVDGFHQDVNYDNDCLKYHTAILHLTDSNGGTLFEDGTLVDCKANRLIFFNGNTLHASMHQTNIKSRYTANFNFILTPELK